MIKLSNEEIEFFKEEGYLIKRKVMNEDLMVQARNRLWEKAPPELDSNNPDTWIGPIKEYHERDDCKGDDGKLFRWYYRSIGDEGWIVRMLATDPSILYMVEQILGKGNIQTPDRIRGIYCTLPEGNTPPRPVICHTDAHAFHLGVVGYIDDVPPNGGGFMIWPKSHRTLYYDYCTQHGNEETNQYAEHLKEISEQPYVDCYGEAGDIIFWHHRLAHAAGSNRSRVIRKAVLYDFRRVDLEEKTGEPPCGNMWRDWPGILENEAVNR